MEYELMQITHEYIKDFCKSFESFYKDISNENELRYRAFLLFAFVTCPDEENYSRVKKFIRRKDYLEYLKITEELRKIQRANEIDLFADVKDLSFL